MEIRRTVRESVEVKPPPGNRDTEDEHVETPEGHGGVTVFSSLRCRMDPAQ
jgi:hypothetical protein